MGIGIENESRTIITGLVVSEYFVRSCQYGYNPYEERRAKQSISSREARAVDIYTLSIDR